VRRQNIVRKVVKDDSGAVLVLTALVIVILLGFAALVVDMGYWYNVRRQLQSAADAAALAGCQELILGGSNAEIWAVVEEFAGYNSNGPVSSLSVVSPSPGGLSDITDDSVKVTVGSTASGFFGAVFGLESNDIEAQARAKIAYLVGVESPMPWALPILDVDRITASAGGGPEIGLSDLGGGIWGGAFAPGSAGDVQVTAWNDQTLDPAYPNGVPEEVAPAARIAVIPSGSRFDDVVVPRTTFTAGYGESVSVYVDTTEELAPTESVVISIGKSEVSLSKTGATSWQGSIAAPTTDDMWATFELDVAIVDGKKDVEKLDRAALLLVRRSSFPILDVRVTPNVFKQGSVGAATIQVQLHEYAYGEQYELKVVGGGGYVGTYQAIDWSTLRHEPYWRHPQDPPEYPDMPTAASTYYDYVGGTASYSFVAHVGDTVWTQPGNLSGPQTISALVTRFAGDNRTFAEWEAAGKPGSTRLVYIPITEKVQSVTGLSPLRILSFAAFYIEDDFTEASDAVVRGRFVDYVAPGWVVSPTPPHSNFVIETPHLVAEGLDF